jgi:hypothetical protein
MSTGQTLARDDGKIRHDFKNQLSIILGFSEMLLAEMAEPDPRRCDLDEIHKAAAAALDLLARVFPVAPDTAAQRPT